AIARADLAAPRRRALGIEALALALIEPGTQDLERLGLVLVLGFLILLGDHEAGRQMGNPNRAVGGIDRLSAGTGGTKNVDPQVLVLDLDVDILGLGQNRDGCRRRMNPPLRFGRRHALYAVNARFKLETGIGAR